MLSTGRAERNPPDFLCNSDRQLTGKLHAQIGINILSNVNDQLVIFVKFRPLLIVEDLILENRQMERQRDK